jgi:hypothetical protein
MDCAAATGDEDAALIHRVGAIADRKAALAFRAG